MGVDFACSLTFLFEDSSVWALGVHAVSILALDVLEVHEATLHVYLLDTAQ